ncbi:hypothetical protein IT417_02825 [bacterium]|nr:hypothetical protein [bacterium]
MLATIVILLFVGALFYVRSVGVKEVMFQVETRMSRVKLLVYDLLQIQPKSGNFVSQYEFVNDNRVGLGIYDPSNNPKSFASVLAFEDMIGHKLNYNLVFRAWGDKYESIFPFEYVEGWQKTGITPVITWEPWARDLNKVTRGKKQEKYSFKTIIEGKHDDYIRQWAKDSKSTNIRLILRFAHEQSTPVGDVYAYPWQGDPEGFKEAYQHVVRLFREEEAFNVEFMWSPLAYWPDVVSLYYPGDGFVDVIGLSILNHGIGVGEPANRWKSCDELFVAQFDQISKYPKKVMVAEFGSAERGGNKAEWLSDCLRKIQAREKVVGLILLEVESDTHYPGANWGVDTSLRTLESFKYEVSVGNFK